MSKEDAQSQIKEEEESGIRKIVLTVLKNRRGKVGNEILYEYHPAHNYFKEIRKK